MTSPSRPSGQKLALEGGVPAVRQALPPMYPGGMRIAEEEEAAVLRVLRTKRLFRYYGPEEGPSEVAELERAFSERMGTAHALATSSGTTALTSALAALGVGPGDEVIVPAYTWIATAAAVTAVGAIPVIAEVDDSLTLDPADAERRITERTRVLLPVHMRGAPADMDAILDVARRHRLRVLEDAAQALGASHRGRLLGTIGDMGAYSLQFNKILTAGEGGMVATGDRVLHERALMYHDVAASQRSDLDPEQTFVGITCRMSELQGAVARVQLERLDGILATMRARKRAIKAGVADLARDHEVAFRRLNDEAGDAAIALIMYLPNAAQARYAAEALTAEGVRGTNLFRRDRRDYHIAYHWAPILDRRSWSARSAWDDHPAVRNDPETWPESLDLLERSVQVDVSPELTEEQAEEVTTALRKVLGSL
jgi:8-amino-3,8-dideoxy-alpha-D-manno-octulosonate transaminase